MNADSDALHSELDYLWRTVREAQDSESRLANERAEAGEKLKAASARLALLEKELALAAGRERRLRAAVEKLKTALEENSRTLEISAAQAAPRGELEAALRSGEARSSALETELARLRSEAAGLREALKGRADTIELLNARVAGMMALPELAAALAADAAASGKSAPVYEHLLSSLEKYKLDAARTARELEKAAAGAAEAREALASAGAGSARLGSELAAARAELDAVRAAAEEAARKAAITSQERTAIDGRAAALKVTLEERETALSSARADLAGLRRELDEAKAATARLREAADEQGRRAEEQRRNFSGAVAQVFELQKRSAGLASELAAAREKNAALSAEVEARLADIEKVNGLLRDAKTGLAQEKETTRRAAVKIKSLEAEIEAVKAKAAAAGDYSARLLRAVEERELLIRSLRDELKKTEVLQLENEDLRRRNIKFSGLLQREQADFTSKAVSGLEKASKDLRAFNLRIPAAERKALEPAMKSVLASINLMKGWQEYMDPETPDLRDAELGPFVSGETGKWERAFKQRKLSISAAIASPRLRARIDEERLKMLFYHVVKNAYENLQPGGNLRVTLKTSEDGRYAAVSFEDSGPGFAKETLDKLFAPFNSTGKGKAGIGLAVASRIAEKHGGTLEVSNRKDRGALVELRLPLGS